MSRSGRTAEDEAIGLRCNLEGARAPGDAAAAAASEGEVGNWLRPNTLGGGTCKAGGARRPTAAAIAPLPVALPAGPTPPPSFAAVATLEDTSRPPTDPVRRIPAGDYEREPRRPNENEGLERSSSDITDCKPLTLTAGGRPAVSQSTSISTSLTS